MTVMQVESINAVTLAVHDMRRSVRFYAALEFSVRYGGEQAAFTSLHAGSIPAIGDRRKETRTLA